MSDRNVSVFNVSTRGNGKKEDAMGKMNPTLAAIMQCPASDIWYKVRTPETDIQGAWFQPPYTIVRWTDGTVCRIADYVGDAR